MFGCILLCGHAPAHHRHPLRHPVSTPPIAAKTASVSAAPPRPDDTIADMSRAVPLKNAARLPSASDQIRALKNQIEAGRPAAESAKRKSDLLNAQAAELKRRLEETTARVQALESKKGQVDAELAHLVPEEKAMSAQFVQDRTRIVRLLAVLERLQSDLPPVIAIRADDALSAARGAMVLGESVPRIYQEAAALSRQLHALQQKRKELTARQLESTRVSAQLGDARAELDQLLAIKSQEADVASAQYGDIEARLEAEANQAVSLESLLARVAQLRTHAEGHGIVTVLPLTRTEVPSLRRGSIVSPVAGPAIPGGTEGVGGARAPGLTFVAAAGSSVVSPGDGHVLFAGSYHKTGKVLILEMGGGYDLVLAGLDRLDVRPGDELLVGEPVGAMPRAGNEAKLYFELRQNGKGVNPTPWMQIDLRKAKRS